MKENIQVRIEKLVFGGQGLGRHNDQVVFVWNALLGELVEVSVTKKKKKYLEGVAVNVIEPSEHRIEPEETHYLSCSPWQMMTSEMENTWKVEMVQEVFEKNAKIPLNDLEIFSNEVNVGYRNKMEYSFYYDDDEDVHLAFYERAGRQKIAIEPCILADPVINDSAMKIFRFAKENLHHQTPKSMIIRSNRRGEVIAGLFVKDKIDVSSISFLDNSIKGFGIYFSSHRSPASVIHEILLEEGSLELEENINGVSMKYGLNSFFQVNLPVFEQAVKDMSEYVDNDAQLLDLYSGVGAIGLTMKDKVKTAVLADINREAIDFAKKNIADNNLENYEAHAFAAEGILDAMKSDQIVIVDPPRAGLHADVVARILEVKPKRILYLSCNPATQARDIALLKDVYDIGFKRLYNFFPQTPHVESLVILERSKT